jgi:ring-1,2-phenylacetyl-CoA epoxidase subunit PaaC
VSAEQIMSGAPQGTPTRTADPRVTEILAHADDNMIIAQRLGEWISNAPELELDIALGNIALDHLGVARALYTLAGDREGEGRGEDDFAMMRNEREFSNLLLVEQPNGDFAMTIVRQVLFDAYQHLLWDELMASDDETLAGIAARARKEADYHFRFSSGWLTRLGDGTKESHRRAQDAVDSLWRFTAELFAGPTTVDRYVWGRQIDGLLTEATLDVPDDPYQRSGGRLGFHTEHLGFVLAEMQWMQRSYPGMQW